MMAPFLGTAYPVAAAGGGSGAKAEAVCPPPKRGDAACLAMRRTDILGRAAAAVSPLISPPLGYGPADIQTAYALPAAGSGMTVAVVDAYDLSSAEADLGVYRSYYGLPDCTTANGCFRKVNQAGTAGPYPPADTWWGLEIALDLEMVSAACPACKILLVEANDSSFGSLAQSVDTAVSLGAVAVSNSYGGAEDPSEIYLDPYYNQPGVAVTVATGDCGYNCAPNGPATYAASPEYPSTSPYVVAVGGTTLTKDSSTRGFTETAWGHGSGGAGSGCSLYEAKPSWQHDPACSKRTVADVSAVADPNTGVAVYDSDSTLGSYQYWTVEGGTSAASPIIAATYALAGHPAAGSNAGSYPYLATTGLNDAIGGNNDVHWGTCGLTSYLCNAVAGYDGPTGLGTPNGTSAFVAPVLTRPTYTALTPARILDTRDGTGGLSGPFSSHVARSFQVTGNGGVPGDATAVTGNLTVTQQTSLGFLFIGPVAMNNPTSSTLNFPVGDDRANAVTVALGAGGTLAVTYAAPSLGPTAHVIFDVTGYFSPATTGGTYQALTPARVLDTRYGTGGLSGPFSSHVARTFQVTGHGGVPGDATAVTGNLTVTQQTSIGFLFMGPIPMNNPTSSTLNFPKGDDRANAVTVALGSGGTLSVTFAAPVLGPTAHVIFDVTGYFTVGGTGAVYTPLTPARILDTRFGTGGLTGPFGSHAARTFEVIGAGGVPADATAVTGNLTVTQQTSLGFLFIGPVSMNSPTSSTLNFPYGDDRANAVTVALGAGGSLSVTYAAPILGPTAHAIFDVTGYFTP